MDSIVLVENGFAHDVYGAVPIKGFISQVNKNLIQYKTVDLNKSLSDSDVRLDLSVPDNGYVYVYFSQDEKDVYIISQRDTGQANCSFINNDYVDVIHSVDPTTDQRV